MTPAIPVESDQLELHFRTQTHHHRPDLDTAVRVTHYHRHHRTRRPI
jgi:hypothetical protein